MLLPEKKEREYRFGLALRMGLPIFGLTLVLVFATLITQHETLTPAFYIESLLLLFVSVYFILYLIYKGFDVTITDPVSKTFTREYLYEYLKKEIQKHERYTLILISVDNITDINSQYGIKNGDKVLRRAAEWIEEYLQKEGLDEFPIGRIKGGDFIIGIQGSMAEHKVLVELLCLKSDEFKIENIEVKISAAITDTTLTKNLDHLIESLFELQEQNRYRKEISEEKIDPTELETLVIEAIENRSVSIASQSVFKADKEKEFAELFVRLKTKSGRYIYQKKYKKVINKLGLTLDFEIMLIEKVLRSIDRFEEGRVVVHISTSSLRNPLFYEKIECLMDAEQRVGERLVLCFSEQEYYFKTQKFNTILHSYKKLGITFAVDHLGVLHSSFLYLRDLDIDIVRFDGTYTKEQHFEEYADVIRGLEYIAYAKGVKTWVKMIENEVQYRLAKELGIDYMQGKYLSQLKEIV